MNIIKKRKQDSVTLTEKQNSSKRVSVDITRNLFSKASLHYSSDGDNEKNTLRLTENRYPKEDTASFNEGENNSEHFKTEPDDAWPKRRKNVTIIEDRRKHRFRGDDTYFDYNFKKQEPQMKHVMPPNYTLTEKKSSMQIPMKN